MRCIGIFFVKLYQKFISPLKPPCCRFSPTCSQYAIEAFREWGFICGLGLTFWRIIRCNPFGRGGYDPVPKRKRKNKNPKKQSKSEENF